MLSKLKTLKGYALQALDGQIGKAKEFYFDDQTWAIRYLVADTGGWLTGRHVLISPHTFGEVLASQRSITIKLTRKQIEDSPSLDSNKPVSHQFERAYYGYYGFPSRWGSQLVSGGSPDLLRDPEGFTEVQEDKHAGDPHLRSTDAVRGQHVEATDGGIGHVEDFIVDEDTWHIRYLVVETRDLWPGKRVLISPHWFDKIALNNEKLYLNLTRKVIKESPEYSDELLIRRNYETALHEHYGLEGYWPHRASKKTNLF